MKQETRRAKTIFSIDEMFQYADTEAPTNKIYVDNESVNALLDFLVSIGRIAPGHKNIVIDSDILMAGLLRFRDCQIMWLRDENYAKMDIFRVVLFPQYMQLISEAGNDMVIFGFLKIEDLIVPLGVQKGSEAIGIGNLFFRNGISAETDDPRLILDNVKPKSVLVSIMAIWYAIELAAIDPITRDLFNNPFPDADDKNINCYAVGSNSIYERINELNTEGQS